MGNPLGRHVNLESLRASLDSARDSLRYIEIIANRSLNGVVNHEEALSGIRDRAKEALYATDPEG